MPRLLERLHTLWAALRLRLRGGAPGLFYIGGSDTMPAPLDRAAEQQAIRALAAGSEEAASLLIEHNLRLVAHIVKKRKSESAIFRRVHQLRNHSKAPGTTSVVPGAFV